MGQTNGDLVLSKDTNEGQALKGEGLYLYEDREGRVSM